MKKILCVGTIKVTGYENDFPRTDFLEYQVYLPVKTVEEAEEEFREMIASKSETVKTYMEKQFFCNPVINMPEYFINSDEINEGMKKYMTLHKDKTASRAVITAFGEMWSEDL